MKKLFTILAATIVAAGVSASAESIDLSSIITASTTVTYSAENDAAYPWSFTDGKVGVTHNDTKSTSWLTVNFSAPGEVKVTVTYSNNASYSDYFYSVADEWENTRSNTSTQLTSQTHYLKSGDHTLKFGYKPYSSTATGYYVSVASITIEDMAEEAIEINLSEAGTLGVEVLSRVNTMPDMKFMRLTGPMNSTDWTQISNMTGLVYCDMTGTTVTDIPASAFVKCPLRVCKFPSNLKAIGSKAFQNRYLLGELTFPASLQTIGSYAFNGNLITGLVIPAGVTSIGEMAFDSNTKLATVDFGGTMTSVPRYCFEDCSSLVSVTGLQKVTTVGELAFNSCKLLETLGEFSPVTINAQAFAGCNALKAIDLSKATKISTYGFQSCYELTSIDLSSLTSLSSNAFERCRALTSVRFNDKITEIPSVAFYDCTALEEVHLGASVRLVEGSAFSSSSNNITKVYVKSPTPPTVSGSPFYSTTVPTLYVPEYAMVSYKLDNYWSKFTKVEVNPESPTEIRLYGDLELTTNARIPGDPDVFMGWASSNGKGASFIINGDNPQSIGDFEQVISNYKYSSYDPCTSTLISRCANMTSTSSLVRYYCDSYNTYWYYICMPYDVRRSDISTTNGADIAVRYYDGEARANYGGATRGSWKDVPADATLKAGQGYIFCLSKADYIKLPATDETHNMIFASDAVSTTLNEYTSTTSADAGWNLVGNPYSCFYDIYQMDYTAPITVWNTDNKTFKAYSVADDELALYPLQAFFVQKPAGVDAITFQPRGRQTTLTIEHASRSPRLQRGNDNGRQVINLTLTDGTAEDMTRIVVNPNESDDFDAATDATKMMSYEGTAQLYTWNADGCFAINEGSHADGTVTLGLWIPQNGTYTIDATRADAQVRLFDRGGQVSMPYTFDASAGTDNDRFTLVIETTPSGINDIYTEADTDDAVYDIMGRRVAKDAKGITISKGKKAIR